MTRKQKINREEDPAYTPYKRSQNNKRKRRNHGKLNSFTWSIDQQILYVEFLKNNRHLFANIEERKKSKVFVQMNLFIKKRGPDQCRSHHQKMSIKYGSIDQIILRLTEEKIHNAKVLLSEQSQLQIQSQIQNPNFEKIIQLSDQLSLSLSEIPTSSITQNFCSQEKYLWDYIDINAWINQ